MRARMYFVFLSVGDDKQPPYYCSLQDMMLQLMAGIQDTVSEQLNQRLGGLEKMLQDSNFSSVGNLENRIIRMEKSLEKINSINQSVR